MPIPWNADPVGSDAVIAANARRVILALLHDAPARIPPTVALAQAWHRALYRGIRVPVPYYIGGIRDSDARSPELIDYEVTVGGYRGVPARDVPDALSRFEHALSAEAAALDALLPLGVLPDASELQRVLDVAAVAHGEWARIHPFANGNGRTARIWVNFIAVRYGLPAFITLKPRLQWYAYAGCAAASMRGDHGPMARAFETMLRDYLYGP